MTADQWDRYTCNIARIQSKQVDIRAAGRTPIHDRL